MVWNATDRDVNRRGLDRKSLETLNPNVIFCQVDCFGGPRRGSRSDDLGYDDIARAVSGIMLRFGGSSETPEGTRTWGRSTPWVHIAWLWALRPRCTRSRKSAGCGDPGGR
ncbi:hypothetical protein GTH44_41170 [Bradyrhizobium japonicum]|nr:hypothetical protein [Bradyrhizobium japonicum]